LPVHKEFKNPCFMSIFKLVWKLQIFVYIVVIKELMIFFLMNLLFFWTPLTCFGKKNNTLVDAQIHGKYNEQRINFIRICIQSACTIFSLHTDSWSLLLYLPYYITYKAETLPVYSSVSANNKETIKINGFVKLDHYTTLTRSNSANFDGRDKMHTKLTTLHYFLNTFCNTKYQVLSAKLHSTS